MGLVDCKDTNYFENEQAFRKKSNNLILLLLTSLPSGLETFLPDGFDAITEVVEDMATSSHTQEIPQTAQAIQN